MATWKPPTAKSAGWSPRGGAWRRAGESMRQFGQDFSAQLLAIKQWEAEEEAKRQKAMQERAMAEVEALRREKEAERDFMIQEMFATRAEDFKRAEAKEDREHEIRLERIRQEGRKKEEEDTWQKELDKHLSRLDKLDTDYGKQIADDIRAAVESGDVSAIPEIRRKVLANSDQMKEYTTKVTTTGGKVQNVTQPSNDINDINGALFYISRLMQEKYGTADDVGRLVPIGAGVATLENDPKFQEDRKMIIEMLQTGRPNDAKYLLKKWLPMGLTEEMVKKIEREAGIK